MSLILYARLHGANLTEYAMILGLFVLLLAGTLAPFGKNFNDLFEALVDPIALASGETATALGGGPFEGVTPFPTEGTVSEVRPMKGPIALDDKNTLYYRVDPATGQLVLNIKQPGQPGQNTTSMEGSEVMEQLAKRLDAMAQASQTSGRPMSVRETMRLRQLAAQARVLAQYQERIDQRKANGQPINTHLLQGNLFSGLLGSYNRFNTMGVRFSEDRQVTTLAALIATVSYQNYLAELPKQQQDWWSSYLHTTLVQPPPEPLRLADVPYTFNARHTGEAAHQIEEVAAVRG